MYVSMVCDNVGPGRIMGLSRQPNYGVARLGRT
jgi:hypothetical protein